MDQEITVVAEKVFELAHVLGVANINKLPGAWVHDVDERWRIAVNGHNEPLTVEATKTHMEATIDPYCFAVWCNGWLAGLMSPFDGILAAGEAANEDALIAALDECISRGKQ